MIEPDIWDHSNLTRHKHRKFGTGTAQLPTYWDPTEDQLLPPQAAGDSVRENPREIYPLRRTRRACRLSFVERVEVDECHEVCEDHRESG